MKHYVPLADDVAESLAGAPRLLGEIDGHAFRRTLQRRPNGEPCLRFGAGWLRDAGLTVGAVVPVVVAPDPDPDRVDLPEELTAALGLDPAAAAAWAALTPGRQRTMAYGVGRAKRPETRVRRALALLEEIKAL